MPYPVKMPWMLTSAPTKLGAGIKLSGDFLDLETVHRTIHKIATDGFAEEQIGGFILGLAYECLCWRIEGAGRATRLFGP